MRFGKNKSDEAGVPVEVDERPSTSKWTAGRAGGSRALSVVLFAAILCGPAALFVAVQKPQLGHASTAGAAGQQATTLQQTAGAYAVGYVGSWLGATKKSATDLQSYVDVNSSSLSDVAWEYRDIGVASLEVTDSVVTVVVAANVHETNLSADVATADGWPRRYFQAVISASNGSLAAVGLPAPVAAPTKPSDSVTVAYPNTLASGVPVSDTVLSFLGAYLTGQGELDRYTSPNTDISPITPAPFTSVKPIALLSSDLPDKTPADGTTLGVLATVTATTASGQQLNSTYAFELKARAGRWEVLKLLTAPTIAKPSPSLSTTTPTPTPTGTKKGN